jgi:hypothetical protein
MICYFSLGGDCEHNDKELLRCFLHIYYENNLRSTAKKMEEMASYHMNFDHYLDYYKINFLEGTAWKYLKWFHNQALCNYCPSRDTLEQLKEKGFRNLDIYTQYLTNYLPECNILLTKILYNVNCWNRR